MSLKSDYNDFITYKDRLLCDKTTKYWINQEERYIEPFQIFGNLYYVGDTWVCVHIVDTGAGLLMLDAGNCGNTALLIESIWEMGFRPEDVKWIILSHGHADHFGAVGFFRRMYGTKIYMGEPDVRMFENNPEQIISYRRVPEFDCEIKHFFLSKCPVNHMTVMFRKEDILKVGGYQHFYLLEDLFLRHQ